MGETVGEIRQALEARFGTSARQAKDKLSGLQRDSRTPLHEQALEVRRLVDLVYPNLPHIDRELMAVDCLLRSFENRALQRHMLVIQPQSLMELVNAINDYVEAGGPGDRLGPTVRAIEGEDQEDREDSLLLLTRTVAEQGAMMAQLMQQLSRMAAPQPQYFPPGPPPAFHHQASHQANQASRQAGPASQPAGCFNCGGPHFKRNCPQLSRKAPGQGNGQGPVQ